MKALTPNQVANKMIKTLKDAGYTYNEMPAVFALAREKFNLLKQKK